MTGNLVSNALGDGIYAQNDNYFGNGVTHMYFVSSLIAGNGNSDVASGVNALSPDTNLKITGTNNLIGTLSGGVVSGPPIAPAGTLNCDPHLLPLADNGGPTRTHALGAGSCAIDAGSTGYLSTDQRGAGYVRVSGAAADIGAFESQPIDVIFRNGFEG